MHIVIIGLGIGGASVAKSLREYSTAAITIVSSEHDSFFSRPALMYVFMGKMRFKDILPFPVDFWVKHNINIIQGKATSVDSLNQQLLLEDGKVLSYDKLILALGSQPRSLGLGEFDLSGVQGFYSLQDVALLRENAAKISHAAIIGGGLIGVELAEMFISRRIPFTFWVREKWFGSNFLPQEEAQMVTNYLMDKKINIRFEREVINVGSDEKNHIRWIAAPSGEKEMVDLVCVCIGVKPNVDWLKLSNIHINEGILVNKQLQTNIPSIYAVGDCAECREPAKGRNSIETLWYTGKLMGEYLGKNLLNDFPEDYEPGIFFNSTKFFDLEYQVYGYVPLLQEEMYASVFWKHPKKYKSIRLVYEVKKEEFVGCCVLGIRFRQKVCEKWIREKWKISAVLQALSEANFDSEFSNRFETELWDNFKNNTL
jgi:NAD(P)H-nitrite reductase large subunit